MIDFAYIFISLGIILFGLRWVFSVLVHYSPFELKRRIGWRPKVSVVMSCYNEGPSVFATIESLMQMSYPKDLLEVVVIDDCSTDNTFEFIQKAAQTYPIVAIRNKENRGKHHNILHGASVSTGEIILCTDSDMLYEENTLIELVEMFADDSIGACGGVVDIKNPNDNVVTKWQTMLYHYGFDLWKKPETLLKTVFCIGGCLFAVRRTVFDQVKDKIKTRKWFGIETKGGEDRYMTHQILLAGYGTIINPKARCSTTAPSTLKQLFMQQLRWKRSSLMMFFWALARPMLHIKRFSILSLAIFFLTPVLSFMIITTFLTALISGTLIIDLVAKFAFSLILFGVVAFFSTSILKKRGVEVNGFLFLPAFMMWYVLIDQVLLPILALLTFDEKGWSSR